MDTISQYPKVYANSPRPIEMENLDASVNLISIDTENHQEPWSDKQTKLGQPTVDKGTSSKLVTTIQPEQIEHKVIDKYSMYYEIEDVPSPFATFFLSMQVYLMMAATTLSGPYLLTSAMCMDNKDPDRAKVVATFMLVSGLVTILQSSFGTRLPIVQGGSAAFLVSTLAVLNRLDPKCDEVVNWDPDARKKLWQERMCIIQGAIIVASIFQVIFGSFGLVGLVLRFITPLTVAPSIMMIGLSLFGIAADSSMKNAWISAPTMVLIIILSQYFRDYKVQIPCTKSPKRRGRLTYKVFQSLPILLGLAIMWGVCVILQLANLIKKPNPGATDLDLWHASLTFYVPYPGQWGTPEVRVGAVLGILTGVISGIIESIGDYFACARLVGAKAPPVHAINRGIFIEGIGCIVAGIWGSASGTTSYSENTGSIGVTQVGSRRVIQIGGVIMVVLSIFGKLNALFVSIPEPIIGAFLTIAFAMITSVGILNLKGVDLTSARNLFVIGFSVFFALSVSQYMNREENRKLVIVSNGELNDAITILLRTGMFLGGFFGFVLDNTIPGTRQERGLDEWEENFGNARPNPGNLEDSYDLPFITFHLQKYKFTSWIPISPTYDQENYVKFFAPIKNKVSSGCHVITDSMRNLLRRIGLMKT